MKKSNLKDMVGGWFVGDFDPAVLRSKEAEVSVKRYKAGDTEQKHLHKIATEITLVVSGRIEMNGVVASQDDMIVIEPGEAASFRSIEDSVTVVVKTPSVTGDKYLIGDHDEYRHPDGR